MVETTKIRTVGNTLGLFLSKAVLEKVYHLTDGSEVEVDYDYPNICIRPLKQPAAEVQS